MTSKSCCSEFRRVTINRFSRSAWLVTLWSIVLFLALPVAQALSLSGKSSVDLTYSSSLYYTIIDVNRIFDYRSNFIVIMSAAMGVVAAAAGFAFANSRPACDFYLSQPISRRRLFSSCYLTGLGIFAVPLIAAELLTVVVTALAGFGSVINFGTVLIGLAYQILAFLIVYNITTFWCVLCGNTVISLLCTLYTFGILPALYYELTAYMNRYFTTYWPAGNDEDIASLLTPFGPFVIILSNTDCMGISWWWIIGLWSLIGMGLAAAAMFLFERRPAERAGRPLAFPKMLPIVKYPLTVCASLVGGLFFYAVTDSLGWEIFGYLLFGTVTFMVVNVLEKFDFRNITKNLGKLAITYGVIALVMAAMALGSPAFDKYMPARNSVTKIEKIYIGGGSTYVNTSAGITDESATDLIYSLCRQAVLQQDDKDGNSGSVRVQVSMKTGLLTFSRTYRLRETAAVTDLLDSLMSNEALRRSGMPIWKFEAENVSSLFYMSTSNGYDGDNWYSRTEQIYEDTEVNDGSASKESSKADIEFVRNLIAALRSDMEKTTTSEQAVSRIVGVYEFSGKTEDGYFNYSIPLYECYQTAVAVADAQSEEGLTPTVVGTPSVQLFVAKPGMDYKYGSATLSNSDVYDAANAEQVAEMLRAACSDRELDNNSYLETESGCAVVLYNSDGTEYDRYPLRSGSLAELLGTVLHQAA